MCDFGAEPDRFFLLFASEQNVRKSGERRIPHCSAEFQFALIKTIEIVSGGVLDGVVVGVDGLYQYVSREVSAPCSTSDLSKQLKSSFGCAKVRHSETDVGGHYTHKGDIRNVVTFRNHLCSDEDVERVLTKAGEDGLEASLTGDRIAIQTRDTRRREGAVQFIFNSLGASTEKIDVLTTTFRADIGYALRVTAVMAEHPPIPAMVCERYGTVDALQTLPAGAARAKTREA